MAKIKKSLNKIPDAHLEEDKASPGEETGEQALEPLKAKKPRPKPSGAKVR